jgi:hypothetical protein
MHGGHGAHHTTDRTSRWARRTPLHTGSNDLRPTDPQASEAALRLRLPSALYWSLVTGHKSKKQRAQAFLAEGGSESSEGASTGMAGRWHGWALAGHPAP